MKHQYNFFTPSLLPASKSCSAVATPREVATPSSIVPPTDDSSPSRADLLIKSNTASDHLTQRLVGIVVTVNVDTTILR